MPIKNITSFKVIPDDSVVSWNYRSAIGHDTVTGVDTLGTTTIRGSRR